MAYVAAATAGCVHVIAGTPAEIQPMMHVAQTAAEYRRSHERWPESLEELCLSDVIIQSVWSGSAAAEKETPAAQRCRQAPYSEVSGLRLERVDEDLILHFSPVQVQGKSVAAARVSGSSDGKYHINFGS